MKKVLFIIIIAIIVTGIFTGVTVYKRKTSQVNTSNSEVMIYDDVKQEEKVEIKETVNIEEVDNVDKEAEKTSSNVQKVEEVKKTETKVTKPKTSNNNTITKPKTQDTTPTKTENKTESNTDSSKTPTTSPIPEEKKEENNPPVEEKPEIKKEETVVPQPPKEEYRVNYEMINKIKTIINNNVTEDMKTYGYNIVVDSTIPELTNQFTFTEKRIIDKIVWKFGTIRIFAQDYYYNGSYMYTECYLI